MLAQATMRLVPGLPAQVSREQARAHLARHQQETIEVVGFPPGMLDLNEVISSSYENNPAYRQVVAECRASGAMYPLRHANARILCLQGRLAASAVPSATTPDADLPRYVRAIEPEADTGR
jgi:hypothetical protein